MDPDYLLTHHTDIVALSNTHHYAHQYIPTNHTCTIFNSIFLCAIVTERTTANMVTSKLWLAWPRGVEMTSRAPLRVQAPASRVSLSWPFPLCRTNASPTRQMLHRPINVLEEPAVNVVLLRGCQRCLSTSSSLYDSFFLSLLSHLTDCANRYSGISCQWTY